MGDGRGRSLGSVARDGALGQPGLDVHHGNVVGNDIVQLPGDAEALVRHSGPGLLLPRRFRPLGPLLQDLHGDAP
jgi:hypothetical protein